MKGSRDGSSHFTFLAVTTGDTLAALAFALVTRPTLKVVPSFSPTKPSRSTGKLFSAPKKEKHSQM